MSEEQENNSGWGSYFSSTLSNMVTSVTETSNAIGSSIQHYVEGDGEENEGTTTKEETNSNDGNTNGDEDIISQASKSVSSAFEMGSKYATGIFSTSKDFVNRAVESSNKYLDEAEEVKFVKDSVNRAVEDTAKFGSFLFDSVKQFLNDETISRMEDKNGIELVNFYLNDSVALLGFDEYLRSVSADTKIDILKNAATEEKVTKACQQHAELLKTIKETLDGFSAQERDQKGEFDFGNKTLYGQAIREITKTAKKQAVFFHDHQQKMMKSGALNTRNAINVLTALSNKIQEANMKCMADIINMAFIHFYSLADHLMAGEKKLVLPVELQTLPHLMENEPTQGIDDPLEEKKKQTPEYMAQFILDYSQFVMNELHTVKTAFADVTHALKKDASSIKPPNTENNGDNKKEEAKEAKEEQKEEQKEEEASISDQIDDLALKSFTNCVNKIDEAAKQLVLCLDQLSPIVVYTYHLQSSSNE